MKKLSGLVICGGQSSRMGEDKSLINYNGKPQREYLCELLQPFCEDVFISCNKEQATSILPPYKTIVDDDKYAGVGPMAGLLSAFEKYPDAAFLVVGCDYPFLRKKHLHDLVEARIGLDDAVFFSNPETNMEEPLICIYENNSYHKLLKNFREKKYSLRHFLREANTCMIFPGSVEFLQSVDTIESYHTAKELLVAKLN